MERTEAEETFLTVAEVAEMLKLNQQTVRNWIDQGSLPALRVGRRVRIKRSDFDRILEESYSGRPTQGGAAGSAEATATSAGTASPASGIGPDASPALGSPTGGSADPGRGAPPTPSAQDFWGGEPVGIPEPVPRDASSNHSNGAER